MQHGLRLGVIETSVGCTFCCKSLASEWLVSKLTLSLLN
jgi:hypothetical protein